MTYSKIQFIGYSISTLPNNITKIEQEYETGEYLGLPNSIEDIDARIVLLEKAIEAARKNCMDAEPTLKIFVVPEFYFRGANGAYTDGLKMDKLLAMDSKAKWDDHLKAEPLRRHCGQYQRKWQEPVKPRKSMRLLHADSQADAPWES